MNVIVEREGMLVVEIPFHMTREFNATFDSLIPELTEDLQRIDFRLQTITSQAIHCGVKGIYVEQLLKERFWNLVMEITGMEGEHVKTK